MKKITFINRTIGIITLLFIVSCASVPMETLTADLEAKAFHPTSSESKIYIARDGGAGAIFTFQVFVNGKLIGSIAPLTYHMIKVKPGDHKIAVTSNENSDLVFLKTQPGENYFLSVAPRIGVMSTRVSITQVSDVVGMKIVHKSKLAQNNILYNIR